MSFARPFSFAGCKVRQCQLCESYENDICQYVNMIYEYVSMSDSPQCLGAGQDAELGGRQVRGLDGDQVDRRAEPGDE